MVQEMTELKLKKGDYGYSLTLTIQESDATAKDLTGLTVTLKYKKSGGSTTTSRTCTVTDAANGKASYTVQNTDFTDTGKYDAEIELTASGYVESTETFAINVVDSL